MVIAFTPPLRHTDPMASGEWTCHICVQSGRGGMKGFYQHYLREHK